MDAKLAVDLSRQWRNGAPASTLKAAGVLLHVIDGGMGGIFLATARVVPRWTN